jgi:hypothetical protein
MQPSDSNLEFSGGIINLDYLTEPNPKALNSLTEIVAKFKKLVFLRIN